MLFNERISTDNFYRKLEEENNKALKWLKEERDVIEFKNGRKNSETDFKDDNVKNESNIFESVNLI